MLAEVLKLAAKGGALTTGEVARALSIDIHFAERLFAELERQGYLKSIIRDCSKACGACANSGACGPARSPRLWAVTQKAVNAIKRITDGAAFPGDHSD